jgi:hypothetical protein
MEQSLPPDVAAYLLQAACQLMSEQGIEPSSASDERLRSLEAWLNTNMAAIAQRAKELQDAMFIKHLAHHGEIIGAACADVYHKLRRRIEDEHTTQD